MYYPADLCNKNPNLLEKAAIIVAPASNQRRTTKGFIPEVALLSGVRWKFNFAGEEVNYFLIFAHLVLSVISRGIPIKLFTLLLLSAAKSVRNAPNWIWQSYSIVQEMTILVGEKVPFLPTFLHFAALQPCWGCSVLFQFSCRSKHITTRLSEWLR